MGVDFDDFLSPVRESLGPTLDFYFERIFKPILKKYNLAKVKLNLYMSLPHAFLEIFSFIILLIICIIFYNPSNISSFLPTMGILVLALKRIQPAVAQIYSSYSQIKIYRPTFDFLYNDIINSYQIYDKNIEGKNNI